MSLLEQYTKSKNLQGFTLGFKKFFDSFTLTLRTNEKIYEYKWNDVMLARGGYTMEEVGYRVPPCRCSNPMGGWGYGILKCPECGHQGVLGDMKFKYYGPTGYADYVDELREFAYEQEKWITSDETQTLYKKNKRELKEECQRRINFFVQALHNIVTGKQIGRAHV